MADKRLNEEIIHLAFKAFGYYKSSVQNYGQDTIGYHLNIRDLNAFCYSSLSDYYTDEEIEHHIYRVVELAFTKLEKKYVGFTYAISTVTGVKQQQF